MIPEKPSLRSVITHNLILPLSLDASFLKRRPELFLSLGYAHFFEKMYGIEFKVKEKGGS